MTILSRDAASTLKCLRAQQNCHPDRSVVEGPAVCVRTAKSPGLKSETWATHTSNSFDRGFCRGLRTSLSLRICTGDGCCIRDRCSCVGCHVDVDLCQD